MQKIRFTLILGTAALLAFFVFIFAAKGPAAGPNNRSEEDLAVSVGALTFRVEVAQTDEERIRGLSERDFMVADRGMLFIFDQSDYHGIWMRGMRFPIDILWLDDNGVVVDLREKVLPETYPEVFRPRRPARYVLEINAGLSHSYGVNVGSSVKFTRSLSR